MGHDQNSALNRLMDDNPEQKTLVERLKSRLANMVMPWASKKWGGIVQYAAGAAIAFIANNAVASGAAWLGNHGVVLTEEHMKIIYNGLHDAQEFIVMAGGVAFATAVQYVQAHWNLKLQIAVGADKKDSWIGPETVAAAEDITPKEIRRAIAIDQAESTAAKL